MCVYVCVCVSVYVYAHTHMCVYVFTQTLHHEQDTTQRQSKASKVLTTI